MGSLLIKTGLSPLYDIEMLIKCCVFLTASRTRSVDYYYYIQIMSICTSITIIKTKKVITLVGNSSIKLLLVLGVEEDAELKWGHLKLLAFTPHPLKIYIRIFSYI